MKKNELQEALEACDAALKNDPNNAWLHYRRANALAGLGRPDEAVAAYTSCIEIDPLHPSASYNRATMHARMQRWAEALADYEDILRRSPGMADAWSNRAAVLQATGRYSEALESISQVLTLRPRDFGAYYNAGLSLLALDRFDEAVLALETALQIRPGNIDAIACLGAAALRACDWERLAKLIPVLLEGCAAGLPSMTPLMMLAISDDPVLQKRCAEVQTKRSLAEGLFANSAALARKGGIYGHTRLRIGYLSSDFRDHPVARQLVGLLESHDRNGFEIVGFATDDQGTGAIRHRIRAACDRFHEIGGLGAREAAQLIHGEEIDILVDLNGHTQGWRPAILAHRPAPICVSYLGYAGTTGADFVDYTIGDPHVTPLALSPAMTEKIVQLPRSFWPTDPNLPEPEAITRAAAGLPETGFVFCCFNANHKIRPDIFASWMRLLQTVQGSVLWIREGSPSIRAHFAQQAVKAGVAASRIVFAPRVESFAVHLGRMRLAGLFLDTFPYNAHVTASDALWAGVPLVTLRGNTFASRVAAGFLENLGLPDLVTSSLADYEQLAHSLATDTERLARIKDRLSQARQNSPFFRVSELARDLEAAYRRLNAGG